MTWMKEPYAVIGRFIPFVFERLLVPHSASVYFNNKEEALRVEIATSLPHWLMAKGYTAAWYDSDVRPPRRTADVDEEVYDWHVDESGAHMVFAVWSNKMPTEIRLKGRRKIFRPKPYEVVLINNTLCEHRGPRVTEEHNRWFARYFGVVPQ